jgi:hypothetical protein
VFHCVSVGLIRPPMWYDIWHMALRVWVYGCIVCIGTELNGYIILIYCYTGILFWGHRGILAIL